MLVLVAPLVFGQGLRQQLVDLSARAHGHVAVACSLPGVALDCNQDADSNAPMQSVFKLPLGLTALHLVEQGKLSFDQPLRFEKSDRILPRTYSPLQDKYPDADVSIPLRDLLPMVVSISDNAAADTVLRALGGPRLVHDYMALLGIRGFHMENNEAGLHREWNAQYRNWFQPKAAVQLLRRLVDDPPLTASNMALLLGWLRDTPMRPNRLKGGVPEGTVVMHKPGTSDVQNGVAAATNDIGLIVLPDGRQLAGRCS